MDSQIYQSTLSKKQLELLEAVESGNLSTVQKLIKESLHQDELFAYVLLVTSLHKEDKRISTLLIKNHATVKISQKTGFLCTPLYYAVKMRDLEIFKALWERGASIHDKDANKESALELAMLEYTSAIIDYLLLEVKLCNIEELRPYRESDKALFHAACWFGNTIAIEMFISLHFSIRSQSSFVRDEWRGFTPLHFALASKSSSLETIIILFQHNDVDFYTQDEQGRTCLHLACRRHMTFLFSSDTMLERISRTLKIRPINPVDENGLSHFHIFCSMKIQNLDSAKHVDFIKHFIKSGVDVNSFVSMEDEKFPGYTALKFAIMNSSWEVSKLLLKNGADPAKTDTRDGDTLLHHVCCNKEIKQEDRLDIVKLLLQKGANPMAKDSADNTPLHVAFSRHADFRPLDESEKLLLSKNQQGINHVNKRGISYLHIACTGDDLTLVKTLVANGAPINGRTEFTTFNTGYSPLHFAVRSVQSEIVEFLLTHGADPNCVNGANITPLHLACRNQDEQYRKSKFEDGQSDDELDWQTNRAEHIRIVELLIKHGACVNAKGPDDSTPLLENCSFPPMLYSLFYSQDLQKKQIMESLLKELFTRQVEVMDLLLRHGADIKARDCWTGPILFHLMKYLDKCPRNLDLIRIALERGADVNVVSISKKPPLQEAIMKISMMRSTLGMSLIDWFLEFGADVNRTSSKLDTALHAASYCSGSSSLQKDIFEKLLSRYYIDVNARNYYGRTPLHNALNCKCDHSIIKKLLDAGSDINAEDKEGNLPFSCFLSGLEDRHNTLEDEENVRKILTAIIVHIKKLMKLDFFVSDKVKINLEKLSQYFPRDSLVSMDSRIDEEATKLKSVMIDHNTSLHQILFEDADCLKRYTENEILKSVIASIRSDRHYTVFGDIIERQYNKICSRRALLDAAKVALSDLSDEDLRNLIKSTSIKETQRDSQKTTRKVVFVGESSSKNFSNRSVQNA